MEAPDIKKIASQTTLHGIVLKDDYAWLRDKKNPEVKAYLAAENTFTNESMAHTKDFQEGLYKEMLSRIKEDDSTVPSRLGNYWYYTRTETGKAYAIHCRKKGDLNAPEEILLDENLLAEGHEFFDLGDADVSPNDEMMAYTVDLDGSENYSLHIKNLVTGELFTDQVLKIADDIEWANDNATIFYVRLDGETHRPYQMYRHKLGTPSSADVLVFEEPDEAYFLGMSKTKDERYIFIDLSSHSSTELHYFSADEPTATPILLAPRQPKIEYDLEHHEGYWYI